MYYEYPQLLGDAALHFAIHRCRRAFVLRDGRLVGALDLYVVGSRRKKRGPGSRSRSRSRLASA